MKTFDRTRASQNARWVAMVHLDTNYLVGLPVKGTSVGLEVDGCSQREIPLERGSNAARLLAVTMQLKRMCLLDLFAQDLCREPLPDP